MMWIYVLGEVLVVILAVCIVAIAAIAINDEIETKGEDR